MRGGVFRVPYVTKSGPKLCEFYHDGFRKQDKGYDNVQDTLPRYVRYDGRNTLANRLKAGICELCGNTIEIVQAANFRIVLPDDFNIRAVEQLVSVHRPPEVRQRRSWTWGTTPKKLSGSSKRPKS